MSTCFILRSKQAEAYFDTHTHIHSKHDQRPTKQYVVLPEPKEKFKRGSVMRTAITVVDMLQLVRSGRQGSKWQVFGMTLPER